MHNSPSLHSTFIHHSTQNPPLLTLIHSLIHTDLMINGWHRFEPLPRFHVPICLGGTLIATCSIGRRLRHGLDREPGVWKLHFYFISFISFSLHYEAPRIAARSADRRGTTGVAWVSG